MSAGNLDQKITIERATTTTDDYGAEVPAWGTYATEWAEIFYGRGDERRQAAAEHATQVATFKVRDNPATRSVTPKDRIQFEGAWDVKNNIPSKDRGMREMEAEKVA